MIKTSLADLMQISIAKVSLSQQAASSDSPSNLFHSLINACSPEWIISGGSPMVARINSKSSSRIKKKR